MLSVWLGHAYPAMPTFGAPCPTTLFTIGMLCFLVPPYPRAPLVAPILWAVVGSRSGLPVGNGAGPCTRARRRRRRPADIASRPARLSRGKERPLPTRVSQTVIMKALNRKLLRDLWRTRTQVLSIALVIACGIGGAIASFSTHESLLQARELYYDTARFPDLFAEAKRAPLSLLPSIESIRGVSEAEVRVVRDTQLDLPTVDQPIGARVIGLALDRPQQMNRLTLRTGRPASTRRSWRGTAQLPFCGGTRR